MFRGRKPDQRCADHQFVGQWVKACSPTGAAIGMPSHPAIGPVGEGTKEKQKPCKDVLLRGEEQEEWSTEDGADQGEPVGPPSPGRDQGSECVQLFRFHGASADGRGGDVLSGADGDS